MHTPQCDSTGQRVNLTITYGIRPSCRSLHTNHWEKASLVDYTTGPVVWSDTSLLLGAWLWLNACQKKLCVFILPFGWVTKWPCHFDNVDRQPQCLHLLSCHVCMFNYTRLQYACLIETSFVIGYEDLACVCVCFFLHHLHMSHFLFVS